MRNDGCLHVAYFVKMIILTFTAYKHPTKRGQRVTYDISVLFWNYISRSFTVLFVEG